MRRWLKAMVVTALVVVGLAARAAAQPPTLAPAGSPEAATLRLLALQRAAPPRRGTGAQMTGAEASEVMRAHLREPGTAAATPDAASAAAAAHDHAP